MSGAQGYNHLVTGVPQQPRAFTYHLDIEQEGLKIGPITDREAELLAQYYGYQSIPAFCQSVPEGAEVIDVGAGLSDFGHRIASERPDIQWTNFDIRYKRGYIEPSHATDLEVLQDKAPSNVHYVGGNILELHPELKHQTFARVFSYYMLQHVARNGRGLAFDAVLNLIGLAAPQGTISIGPLGDRTHGRAEKPKTQAGVTKLAAEFVCALTLEK